MNFSDDHLPPTVKSSRNHMYIDVHADEASILYARYYSQAALDNGSVVHRNENFRIQMW